MAEWRWMPARRGSRRWATALMIIAASLASAGCGGLGVSSGHAGTPTRGATVALPTFTPTPITPTPTAQEARLNALVSQATGNSVQQIQTTYSAATGAADVTISLGGSVPPEADKAATQERVKALCFDAQRALWTSGTAPLSEVNVAVVGPVIDQYADITTQAYGSTLIKSATAARLNWSALSPDAAWAAYDNVYLRDGYNDAS